MLDGISVDQLRTFIAAADEGSFSAVARKFRRAQSAVSTLIGNLEAQVGVRLFDRSGRYPKLTSQGAVLLADARAVVAGLDQMRARAKGISSGIEPELCVVIDVMFPLAIVTETAKSFRETFPRTPLRIFVEVLGSSYGPLLDGRASLGILGPLPAIASSLTSERLAGIHVVMVAASEHPLASYPGMIPIAELRKHTQLVLTDRSALSEGKEFYVFSPFTWRLADLSAKSAFLLGGLGFGTMPFHAIENEVDKGRLVVLTIEDVPKLLVRPLSAIYPPASPPGPAGRWFIDRMRSLADSHFGRVVASVGEGQEKGGQAHTAAKSKSDVDTRLVKRAATKRRKRSKHL
ncbi:MAG: LysR family transcriptional regulator [Xanthobacteraceae bacterium]|nr:LysR family transcriptional regulator [Xanthobacteraceae bacterium]